MLKTWVSVATSVTEQAGREVQIQFALGETYANRQGQYTILEVRGSKLRVRYDDGTLATLDANFQRRIIENMMRELASLTSGIGVETGDSQRRFMLSIGFLSLRSDLQAEMPRKAVEPFVEKYRDFTGRTARPGDTSFYILNDPWVDKWGPELRIYFEATPNQLSELYFGEYIRARDGHYPGQYRINNNVLFYKLLELGFVLGPLQAIDRIRKRIPAPLREMFDLGVQEARRV